MHLKVPLKNLRYGHEAPVHPSNARIAGRLEDIPELAANIFSRGLIEDLLVFDDGVQDEQGNCIYFVSDGNRSLAALRMVYREDSSEEIDCKVTTAEAAFEDSLAIAVLQRKLHPVDEYEGFARLREQGKTEDEIARQYGLSQREVEQVLALGGSLSPGIRELWRKGTIKADAAKAFTMAGDHAAQDALFDKIAEDNDRDRGELNIDARDIKRALKIDHVGMLVEFVGIDAYVAAGGKVTRDLFGTDHKISDAKLAKKLADKKLLEECARLKEAGWSFAIPAGDGRNHQYTSLKVDGSKPTAEERQELAALQASLPEPVNSWDDDTPFASLNAKQQAAYLRIRELERSITLRAYSAKLMEKSGCFVAIDDNGMLTIEYGRVKPEQKAAAAKEVKAGQKQQAKAARETAAKTAAAEGKPAPEEEVTLSNALKERLELQLVAATRDAIAGEPQLAELPLFEILARVVCAQIVSDRAWGTPDAVRTKLPSIRQALNADVFNAAIAKRFDADDYFATAPKVLVVKVIAEAINPDEARKASTGHATTADLRQFALRNLAKTGWLPGELRTVHYRGPGSEGYKRPATAAGAANGKVPKAAKDALKSAEKALKPLKRAAAARKAVAKKAVKTVAKKKTAKKRKAA